MGLRKLIAEAESLLREAGVEDPKIQLSKSPEYGEISSTVAFQLARPSKKNPLVVAEELMRSIDLSNARLVASVEAVNGYLNFKVDWNKYAESILREVFEEGERYGSSRIGEGKQVIIEHTSVNPNKPLHIGHARNTCLGDTIARILKFLGYDLIVLNYIDDSGTQMADVVLGFSDLGYQLDPPENMRFDEYCGDVVYVESVKRAEADPVLAEKRRQIVKEIESRSGKYFELNKLIVERVLRDQLKTCWRLGARYDVLNMESDVLEYRLWDEVFEKLREKNAVYYAGSGPKTGCWLLDLSGHPVLSREGDEVLVKSDHTTTYIARDIAYAAWKLGGTSKDFTYEIFGQNPDGTEIYVTSGNGSTRLKLSKIEKVINVIDVRQRRPQEIVKYALGLLGLQSEKYIHYAYEVVALSRSDAEKLGYPPDPDRQVIHMSGRRGLYVKADQLIDMLRDRAAEEVAQRHPDWDRRRVEEVAEKIAVGALRYSLIKPDIDKMIILNTEEMLKLEGDTAPYLQYTYARACRILEKSDSQISTKPPDNLTEDERTLLRRMTYLPILLQEFGENLLVKPIANYAYKLASDFNNFYEKSPVLWAEESVKSFRLGIVKAFTIAFGNVLRLLGIPIIELM
ncbi:MAG: arginine--tRNA ligase [Nitrososphaeria archaeon]|nr:arginine--tRNA ligase [Nitrososphaeria archaeon]